MVTINKENVIRAAKLDNYKYNSGFDAWIRAPPPREITILETL